MQTRKEKRERLKILKISSQVKNIPEKKTKGEKHYKEDKSHLGAERCALLTTSSLKSKCPTLHLGDLRNILLSFPPPPSSSSNRIYCDCSVHTHRQTPFLSSNSPRAGVIKPWQTLTDRSGLEHRERTVYLTACPVSLFIKMPQISRCVSPSCPAFTWPSMMSHKSIWMLKLQIQIIIYHYVYTM